MRARKAASPEALARKAEKEERAAKEARAASQKQRLAEYLAEQGIVIKSPEERAAEAAARREKLEALAREAEASAPNDPSRSSPCPTTLAALGEMSGPYSSTVTSFAVADAVKHWACHGMDRMGQAIGHPEPVIALALNTHMAQIWRDIGATRHGIIALCDLKPETRSELEEVFADTRAEWEAADSPGLDKDRLWFAYRYLHGHIWTGELASFPGAMPTPAHDLIGLPAPA